LCSCPFDAFEIRDGLALSVDFRYPLELLSGFCLLVEKLCVLIPNFQLETSRFLLPVFLFFSAGLVPIFLQL
jgi:hypothetical protein